MSRETYSLFPPGSLVVVTRGRHAGSLCVSLGVVDAENNAKILIADGRRIRAGRPKRKNARHVERTGVVLGEVAQRLARGEAIDDGWLCEVIARSGR